jgi:hypothetical protein
MPKHIDQRIAFLRKLVKDGLFQENLDKIVVECNALAQDTSYVLTFFVLKHLFQEMSAALEGEAVNIDQHKELASGIGDAFNLILDKVANNEQIEITDLESIVRTHIRNVNIFRSDR